MGKEVGIGELCLGNRSVDTHIPLLCVLSYVGDPAAILLWMIRCGLAGSPGSVECSAGSCTGMKLPGLLSCIVQ